MRSSTTRVLLIGASYQKKAPRGREAFGRKHCRLTGKLVFFMPRTGGAFETEENQVSIRRLLQGANVHFYSLGEQSRAEHEARVLSVLPELRDKMVCLFDEVATNLCVLESESAE